MKTRKELTPEERKEMVRKARALLDGLSPKTEMAWGVYHMGIFQGLRYTKAEAMMEMRIQRTTFVKSMWDRYGLRCRSFYAGFKVARVTIIATPEKF